VGDYKRDKKTNKPKPQANLGRISPHPEGFGFMEDEPREKALPRDKKTATHDN
jgi:hypothetical protein